MKPIRDVNRRRVDLNLLTVLDALLDERNVTRAAARVHLSQPAASNALARLRHLFADPLLVRGQGQLVLTPRAAALVEPLREAMRSIAQTLHAGADFDPATSTETFTIATSDALQIGLLPTLLERLIAQAPGVRLRCLPLSGSVKTTGDPVPEQALASGEVDLTLGFFMEPGPQLHTRALFDGDFVCLLRKGHALGNSGLTLRQLVELGHVAIAATAHEHSTIDVALAHRKVARRIVVVVAQYNVVPYVVSRSDLVALVPRRLAEEFARLFSLQILEPPLALPTFTISQLWHERTHRSLPHRWLRGVVSELASGLVDPRRTSARRTS